MPPIFKKLIIFLSILALAGGFVLAVNKYKTNSTRGNQPRLVFEEIRQWQIASDAVTNSGTIIYGDKDDNGNLNFRAFSDPSTVGSELTTVATGGNDDAWVKIAASPTREEKIAVKVDVVGRMDVLTCTSGCDVAEDWTLRGTYSTAATDANAENMRVFDVAYEQLSGDAIVFFTDDNTTGTIYYCVWDGTIWSPSTPCGATFAPDTSNDIDLTAVGVTGQPEWIRAVSRGDRLTSYRSDEMLLAVSDSNDDMWLAHWDGSAIEQEANPIDDLSDSNAQKFDIAWEETTGEGMAVFTDIASAQMRYSIYTSSGGWGSVQTDGPTPAAGNWGRWLELASDPASDDIAVIGILSAADADAAVWTGASWTDSSVALTDCESGIGKNVAVAFERFSGRAIFYNVGDKDLDVSAHCWTSAGGFTALNGAIGTFLNADDVRDVIVVPSPNSNRMIGSSSDVDDTLEGWTYTATTGCADADWINTSTGQLHGVGIEGATGNTVRIAHDSAYTPYSPWSRNWRFYDDETSDNPMVGLNGAAENATPANVDPEELIRLRMQFRELGNQAQTVARKKLQYTSGCNPNTSETACTWTDVGDVTETSAVWRYASQANGDSVCANCNDNTAITFGLTGSSQNGTYITDKDAVAGANMNHNALATVEYDYPLKAENVIGGTTYYFRAYDVDQQSSVFRRQDSGTIDCLSAACAYPSLSTSAPDLTWATAAADFEIWESSSLTWDAGTLICSGTLTDDNGATISCTSDSIANLTQYRVQTILKNTGPGDALMNGASEYVEHKNVKGGWAGTTPTLGTCGFNDLAEPDDNGSTTCSIAWSGNDARITNTGAGDVKIAKTSGIEGFMYLITTDADPPSTNSTSYLDVSIDSDTENSSKITITADLEPLSTSSSGSANSFQRKTWYDGTRFWKALNSGSEIQFWYSTDETNWTINSSATISVATNDFSIEADSTYAFIAYTEGNDIKARSATSYPGVSFSWGDTSSAFSETVEAAVLSDSEYEFNAAITSFISVSALSATQFAVGYKDDGGDDYGIVKIGTVSGTGGSATVIYSSEYEFNAVFTYDISVSALSSTQFAVGYMDDGGDGYGELKIGTVSGTGGSATVTYSSEYEFNAASTWYISVSALSSTQFAVGYMDDGGDDYGELKIVTVPDNYSSEYEFNAASTVSISVSSLSATQFAVGYRDADTYGKVKIGTVSGTGRSATVTYSSEYEFNAATTNYISVSALSSTQFAVGYKDDGGDDYGIVKIGTVSGTGGSATVTYSSEYEFNAAISDYISVSALSATQFAVGYLDWGDFYSGLKIGTVSGTGGSATVTYSSEYEFDAALNYGISVSALSATQFAVGYDSKVKIGTVSGTGESATVTYSSEYEFNAADSDYISVSALSSTQFVVGYRDDGGSDYGIVRIGTVSGTGGSATVTYSNEYEFNAANTNYISVSALSATQFAVGYRDNGDSDHGKVKAGTVSGTGGSATVTYSSEYEFNTAISDYVSVSALSATQFAVGYQNGGDSSHGKVKIGTVSLEDLGIPFDYPSIIRDTNNKIWATAVKEDEGSYSFNAVQSSSANDISVWETVSVLDTSANSNKYGTIVPLLTGNMYSVWIDNATIEGKKYTGSWGTVDFVATGITGMTKNMSAVSDSDGYVHLSYIDSSNYVKYQKYTTSWQSAVALDSTATNEYSTIAIDTAGDNGLYAFWTRDNNVYYKRACSPYTTWGDLQTFETAGGNSNDWSVAGYEDFGSGKIFAEWTQGAASPYEAKWKSITPTTCSGGGITIAGTSADKTSGTVKIAVNGSVQAQTGTIAGDKSWSIASVTVASGNIVTVWVDAVDDSAESTAVTKYDGDGDIANMVLTTNILSIGSDDTGVSIALSDLGYDCLDDEDIMHNATTVATTLEVEGTGGACTNSYTSEKINILSGDTLTIGGTETLATHDVAINGSLTSGGASTYNISGSWDNNADFNSSTETINFTSTGTETIDSTSATDSDVYNVILDGASGQWTLTTALVVNNDLTSTNGTLVGTQNLTVAGGDIICGASCGTINLTGGTTNLSGTGNFGTDALASNWTFYNLTFGDGAAETSTSQGTGTITVSNVLTIAGSHTLNAGNKTWTLSKSGAGAEKPFIITGTFTPATSTISYEGGAATDVALTTYHNLTTNGTGPFTAEAGTLTANGNITSAAGVFNLGGTTNVTGNVSIENGATLVSTSDVLTINGNYTNAGTFTHNSGEIIFAGNASSNQTVTTADQAFYTFTLNNDEGTYDEIIISGALDVNGVLTITDGELKLSANNPAVNTAKDVTVGASGTIAKGTNIWTFDGGITQVLTSQAQDMGNIQTSTASTHLDLADALDADSVIIDSSTTLDSNGFNITVGGSWANSGTFTAGVKSVTFDAASTGKTIEAGSSTFYDLIFNNSAGGWTIQTNNLTATNDFTITDTATSGFTLGSGRTLEVQGTYSIADAETANTTWTGSVLYLNSATAYTVGSKTQTAETYATLQIGANTDIRIWNSSASTAHTVDAAGSLYSQDHANADGDLYIWGDYNVPDGGATDYWSYATDFNGDAVTRQVDVTLQSGVSVTVGAGESLQIKGGGLSDGSDFTVVTYAPVAGSWNLDNDTGSELTFQEATINYLKVNAGTVTVLNTTLNNEVVPTAGAILNADWYLGAHVVDEENPATTDINTATDAITISENTGTPVATVYKYSGGAWTGPATTQTTETDENGLLIQPGTNDAIRIREYKRENAGFTYYDYNMHIDWTDSYGTYDYKDDQGGYYITSTLNTGSSNDQIISESWLRNNIDINNTDGTRNDPPANGAWYVGMLTGLSVDFTTGDSITFADLASDNFSDTASTKTRITVSTSAANGYVVTAWEDGLMTCASCPGTPTIQNFYGTYATPQLWSDVSYCKDNSNFCGFGFTSSDTIIDTYGDLYVGATKYAGFSNGSTNPIRVMDYGSPANGIFYDITYRISVSNTQQPGDYSTNIVYIVTAEY